MFRRAFTRGRPAVSLCAASRATLTVALMAICETDVVYGAETCIRVGECTPNLSGRRNSLCPMPVVLDRWSARTA